MEDLNSFLFVRVLKETLRYLFWHGNLGVTFFFFKPRPSGVRRRSVPKS